MSIFNPRVNTQVKGRYQHRPSYYSRLTSKMGALVPVLCKRVNPGDWWQLGINSITRLAPVANPVYDRVQIRYDAFYVQNRIIDKDWKDYITGSVGLYGEEPTDGMLSPKLRIKRTQSQTNASNEWLGTGSLFDYLNLQFNTYVPTANSFGVPAEMPNLFDFTINAEPILCYGKIYDDWYRNERLETRYLKQFETVYDADTRTYTFVESTPGSAGFNTLFRPLKANYLFDPYTTALTTPLVGGPINIPTGSSDSGVTPVYVKTTQNIENSPVSGSYLGGYPLSDGSKGTPVGLGSTNMAGATNPLVVDIKAAVGATLQELNFAYALFRFFMTDTYNGNRYTEFMTSHFGVVVPDSTLERPIFLGRVSSYLNFSEVFQTSASTEESALGDYAGKGVGVNSGKLINYAFEEHGYIMVIMSIVPDTTYFQGFDNMWKVVDRFGHFFPEFQNIGDVALDVRNIYMDTGDLDLDLNNSYTFDDSKLANNTFGFNRANIDYIWFKNEMHGNFLIDTNMYSWTFARKFANTPILDETFGKVPSINTPFVFTAPDSQNFYTDIYFDIKILSQVEKYTSFTTH